MTDRSSEERSRFEQERAKFEAWYRDHSGTVSIWESWQARAALEDKQEAAPAPEVQGKEPQVWRPQVELIRREMMKRFPDTLSMEEIASCAYAISTANYSEGAPPMKTFGEFWETVTDSEIEDGIEDVAKRAYLSGEAAGRRSAITEMKQSAQSLIAARTAWLEQHGVPISREFANFAEAIGDLTDLIAECAELEEKTRP